MKNKVAFLICCFIWLLGFSSEAQQIVNFDRYTVYLDSNKVATTAFYRLTKEMVEGSSTYDRPESFKAGEGVSPNIYTNTGFDRGHLAASAHMTFDSLAAKQANDMSNVIPELPFINRQVIKGFEQYEMALAKHYGCILIWIDVKQSGYITEKNLPIPAEVVYTVTTCARELLGEYRYLNVDR